MTGFQLHLKYEGIPLHRRGDGVIMEFAMEGGLDKEDLLAISRVKGKVSAIFRSDLVTADGKHLEIFAFQKESSVRPSSKYRFPREEPTDHNWQVWIDFWRQPTAGNFQLHTPLGGWIAPTHR